MRTRTTHLGGIDWPTREEWAKQERTVWLGDEIPGHCWPPEAALLTPEEVAATVADLVALERANRRAVRRARKLAGPLARQPGERKWAALDRYLALPPEARDLVGAVESLLTTGKTLRALLKVFRAGALPETYLVHRLLDVDVPSLALLLERREARRAAAAAAWLAEVEARPIDDAAWERELARRREVEAERAAEDARRPPWVRA